MRRDDERAPRALLGSDRDGSPTRSLAATLATRARRRKNQRRWQARALTAQPISKKAAWQAAFCISVRAPLPLSPRLVGAVRLGFSLAEVL
jgi:hypothetical protein